MTKPRTQKRSRSGAAAECQLCHKRLRGTKGLEMHVRAEHDDRQPFGVAQAIPGKAVRA